MEHSPDKHLIEKIFAAGLDGGGGVDAELRDFLHDRTDWSGETATFGTVEGVIASLRAAANHGGGGSAGNGTGGGGGAAPTGGDTAASTAAQGAAAAPDASAPTTEDAAASAQSTAHCRLSHMLLDVSNRVLADFFKHRWTEFVRDGKRAYRIHDTCPEIWDDTPVMWNWFVFVFGCLNCQPSSGTSCDFQCCEIKVKFKKGSNGYPNVPAHQALATAGYTGQYTCRVGNINKHCFAAMHHLKGGDTSTFDTSLFNGLLATARANQITLGVDLKISNSFTACGTDGIDFIRCARNCFYAHRAEITTDTFVYRNEYWCNCASNGLDPTTCGGTQCGAAGPWNGTKISVEEKLGFEDIMGELKNQLESLVKATEGDDGVLMAQLKADIKHVDGLGVLTPGQLLKMEERIRLSEPVPDEVEDLTSMLKAVRDFQKQTSQKITDKETLVLGTINLDDFSPIPKVVADLHQKKIDKEKDGEVVEREDVELVITTRLNRTSRENEKEELLTFLTEKAGWIEADAKFGSDEDHKDLEQRCLRYKQRTIPLEKWCGAETRTTTKPTSTELEVDIDAAEQFKLAIGKLLLVGEGTQRETVTLKAVKGTKLMLEDSIKYSLHKRRSVVQWTGQFPEFGQSKIHADLQVQDDDARSPPAATNYKELHLHSRDAVIPFLPWEKKRRERAYGTPESRGLSLVHACIRFVKVGADVFPDGRGKGGFVLEVAGAGKEKNFVTILDQHLKEQTIIGEDDTWATWGHTSYAFLRDGNILKFHHNNQEDGSTSMLGMVRIRIPAVREATAGGGGGASSSRGGGTRVGQQSALIHDEGPVLYVEEIADGELADIQNANAQAALKAQINTLQTQLGEVALTVAAQGRKMDEQTAIIKLIAGSLKIVLPRD